MTLRPADPADVRHALAYAMRHDGRRPFAAAGPWMADVAAGALIQHLLADGFVLMRRAPKALAASDPLLRGPG